MPIRQGGVLASRASTWPRDHFCRSTMAPRLSRPMTWKEFLPISMPATAIAVLSFEDIACSLSLAPLASVTCWRGRSTAGPFHYRSLGGSKSRTAVVSCCAGDVLSLFGQTDRFERLAAVIVIGGDWH